MDGSTVTANPVLTVTLNEFFQSEDQFAAGSLLPVFYSGESSEKYYVFNKENLLNIPTDLRRNSKGEYPRVVPQLSDDAYCTEEFGVEIPVSDRERKKYSKSFDADKAATMQIGHIMLVNRELRAKALADTITNTSSPSTKWDAASGSTPIKDVKVAKAAVRDACGLEPNLMVMSSVVWDAIEDHPDVVARLKDSAIKVVTKDVVAKVFGIREVVVAGGLRNTANEGQTINAAHIWSDDVIIAHVNPSQDLKAINFGRTFAWTGETGGGSNLALVETYREDKVRSDIHRGRHDVDEKVTGMDCAYRLSDVLT